LFIFIVPRRFDSVLALRQLKYAGLFEAIHIRKAGYSIRMSHEQFVQRYKHCTMSSMKLKRGSNVNLKEVALTMLTELAPKVKIENPATGMKVWAVGRTRVFFKSLRAKYALEECRNNSVDFVVLQIQRVAR
jgi:myosin V